jgi:hypothetical protein
MQSLDTGVSPRLNVRLPGSLRADILRAAGPGRGAEARWVRQALRDALARHNDQSTGKDGQQ